MLPRDFLISPQGGCSSNIKNRGVHLCSEIV
nr:unnamed protein product [Callosobruchus chinensis]